MVVCIVDGVIGDGFPDSQRNIHQIGKDLIVGNTYDDGPETCIQKHKCGDQE